MVMQNSSNAQKPKSSKQSRTEDLEDSKEQPDESLDTFGGGSSLNEIPTIVICQRDNRQRGRTSRGRDDGRPPFRGTDRRGGGRGIRGGPFRSRNERDGESSSYSSRSKFQESMTRSSYKHSNDSDVFKNRDGVSLLPEDCRISKLLRRLGQEEDLEKFFAITKQLKEALVLSDNGRYIRRSLEYILDSLLEVLHSAPSSDARTEGAKCLGVVGIALDQDAKRLVDWIFVTYHRERNDVRVLLMKSLQYMLSMDSEELQLGDIAHNLMTQMQHALEGTDKPDLLQATCNVILALHKSYPATFGKFFRDIVDILIGWHIDKSQPESVTQYASYALQQLRSCWVSDLSFSLNLLSQFLEDMEAYSEDLVQPLSGRSSPEEEPAPSAHDCLMRITSIIQVFTTVSRSLGSDLTPCEGSPVTTPFLIESLNRVLCTALITMDHEELQESVLVAANECVCLLLGVLGIRGSSDSLYKLIKKLLKKCPDFTCTTVVSTLELISKCVRECSANLPEWLIHELLGPSSSLLQLRFSPLPSVQKSALDVYHSLLSLKNIPLLQEAYRYVLQDLGRAYCLIVPEVEGLSTAADAQFEPYKIEEAENVVLFLLNALSDLARASSSIIGMWALKPTIMELLSVTLLPEEATLACLSPTLQYSITYLLYTHCSRYNNFVSSTGLVISARSSRPQLPGMPVSLDNSSPTSGHLTIILKLVANVLTKCGMWLEIQVLGLRWATELIVQAKSCLASIASAPSFSALVNSIVKAGMSVNLQLVRGVATCLTTFFSSLTSSTFQDDLLHEVVELCLVHIHSPDASLRHMYHHVLSLLPWHQTVHHMTIILANKSILSNIERSPLHRSAIAFNLELVHKVNKIHCVRSDCGEMGIQHFRTFMAFLLQGAQQQDVDWVGEMVCSCIPAPFADMEDDTTWLRVATSGSQAAQLVWGAWQAAQFCVTYKLRTPLGKPLETFTSIEGAIKNLARTLNNESTSDKVSSSPTSELHRARMLLLFLEYLEKAIYSAAEGCAIAMPTQNKLVRAFFHTNKAVCGEWMFRVRWATMLVATYCLMPSVVVRHGYCLMQDQLDQNNIQGGELEKAVVLVCNALVVLREPEALVGVYAWCKEKTGRRLSWVKAAALHAAAKFEEAVLEYSKLLSAENCETQDPLVVSFLFDQMSECLRLLGDWTKLVECKEEHVELCNTPTLTTLSSALTVQHVRSLCDFSQLTDTKIEVSSGSAWRPSKLLASAQEQLYSSALSISKNQMSSNLSVDLLESCNDTRRSLQKLMEEGVRGGPQSLCPEVLVLQQVATALVDKLAHQDSTDAIQKEQFVMDGEEHNLGSGTLAQVLLWSNVLHKADQSHRDVTKLQLLACHSARKEGNFGLAKRLLANYWREKLGCQHDFDADTTLSGLDPVLWVQRGEGLALKETAKLFYCLDESSTATNLLAQSALVSAQEAQKGTRQEVASCLLLSLAKKLSASPQSELSSLLQNLSLSSEDAHLGRLLHWCANIADTRKLSEWEINIPDALDDACQQQLLQLSMISCPRNAKAWSQFASWSYRRGRHASEWEEEMVGTDTDRDKLATILGVDNSTELCEAIMSMMQKPHQSDDNIDLETLLPSDTIDFDTKLRQINSLWSQRSQSHRYYHASAIAYFKFLQLCEAQETKGESSIAESILTATLRLLRLIVKHAHTLQDVLDEGLAYTPTTPWKGIIPQLFARLSHPENYVRLRLSELLCRLAKDAPHLILFPAIVGCSSHKDPQKSENLFDTCIQDAEEFEDEEIDEEEDSAADESQTLVLRSCFLAMVDELSRQAPASTSQVRLLVSELRRITILWDELWLGCLLQHHPDIVRRLSQLESELSRLEDNESLSETLRQELAREKYRIIMKPIILIFEQLQSMTSKPPETPHEKVFQEKFADNINDALNTLKNPPHDKPIKPQACWLPLRQLQTKLQTRAQRRTAHTLKLSDISPALAGLKDSAIAMPGLSQSQPLVTIAALENCVSVLPTKTRPKKIVLAGSDGKSYTYLFKGLEDLHLDERIMQFLSIANTMMARVKGVKFQARHYSVVPLGARSGLISWVDGVQPMFGLYKRWQLRDANVNQLRNQQAQTAPSTVPRPSELFYNKLAPLLAERGIAVENRKEWPAQVLKQVLIALINETPRDLLAKELWCMSANAEDWWHVTRTYSRSVAVMSVIGYIIGLGDRHLDNLLINLATGEVVHIDYNVCFEKGQTLRVPEKVPFRMTSNLQTALGVTGCEGIFRVSCEQVLRVLKRGRETLLTLLEAFVYDPLIDWTPGSEAGFTGAAYGGQSPGGTTETPRPSRRELEREAAQAMLAVRVTEMKVAWLNNRDELLNARSRVLEDLMAWFVSVGSVHNKQEELQDALQQMALLKEAAVSGASHPLFSLQARHSTQERAQDAKARAIAALKETRDQAHQLNNRLQATISTVRGPELAMWMNELPTHVQFDDGGRELFDLVQEFLLSAGQSSVMAQCEQSERESARLVTQMQISARTALDLLRQYAVVVALFPPQHVECIHDVHQEKLSEELLKNLTSERCRLAMAQMECLCKEPSLAVREQAVNYNTQLQVAHTHATIRLQAAYKRLSIEGPEDPTQRLEAALVLARSQASIYASEPNTASALTVAALQQLCGLNNNLLTLEAAAASSGDSLVDLTLREGDWFLDKLLQMSGIAAEIAETLSPITLGLVSSPGQLASALHCLMTAHSVYKGLEDLLWSVSSIIVPEAVSALTTQNASVLNMVRAVNDLVASAKRPLSDICKEIEVNLRYLALDLVTPHANAQLVCAELREGLQELLNQEESPLSAGQMLLMGFNGLFERLQHDAGKLILALTSLSTPTAWGRLDQLHKTKALNWSIMKEGSQSVIEDLFLLRRLQVVQEFFILCGQMALGFSGQASSEYISEETLVKPVRRFSADFVRHQLIGLQPQAIAVAICVVLEEALNINLTDLVEQRGVGVEGRVSLEDIVRSVASRLGTEARLGQASALLGQLESAWRLREGAALAQREAEAATASAHRQQFKVTSHLWITDAKPNTRGVFMAELNKALSSLANQHPGLMEACEEQKALVANITQRLKWAAGANPTLSEVLMAFNLASSSRQDRMQGLLSLSNKLMCACSAILHLETLRHSCSEGAMYNSSFMQLLRQCEHSATLMEAAQGLMLTPAEEGLARLLLPDQNVDMTWILSAESVVSGHVKQLGLVLSSLQAEQSAALEVVRGAVADLRTVLTIHHGLVAGVRSLLRTLAKPGEGGQEGLSDYLARYRHFSEQFSGVVRILGCDQLEATQAEIVIQQLNTLEDLIRPIFENLLELPGKNEKAAMRARPPLLRQESVCMSPQHGVPAKPHRDKAPQEKNAYALSVWRRVRAKLEGRDPDPNKKISVQEQVDFIINEATSVDNLCLLYEGWTPWV